MGYREQKGICQESVCILKEDGRNERIGFGHGDISLLKLAAMPP
jgi:hypothetical protein